MTNEELLESAAKAAGLTGFIRHWNDGPSFIIPGDNPVKWNPLTDDGDALRLAVKLELRIATHCNQEQAYAQSIHHAGVSVEDWNGDPYAATRRAIVRAAAEIGVSIIQLAQCGIVLDQ